MTGPLVVQDRGEDVVIAWEQVPAQEVRVTHQALAEDGQFRLPCSMPSSRAA